MRGIKVQGIVELFPQKGGWVYIRVPKKISQPLIGKMDRGLLPITVSINKTKWNTSLLPMGDGIYFIALKADVRKKENIEVGKKIKLEFVPRFSW